MKLNVFFSTILLFLTSCHFAQKNVSLINSETLITMCAEKNKSIKLIDVRTETEFKKGSIDNALNIDFWDPEFDKRITECTSKKDIVIVFCAGGGRSAMACKKLNKMSYKELYDLEGGYESFVK